MPRRSGKVVVSFVRSFGVLVVGVVAILVGAVLVPVGLQPTTPGWFAYTPLSGAVYAPPTLSSALVVGLVLLGVGILLVAGWAGYRLGARRRAAAQA